MKPRRVAAIDIGSNSIKLAVAEAGGDCLNVILQQRTRVRLGESLSEKFLSPEAAEKSAAVVRRFRAIAESCGAETIVA
ncbi:MAG: hypothetical protein M3384_14740, partial [Acidobacteriota bacterium]|nr:hypothetical protein [Acidobacteriota bacterium]